MTKIKKLAVIILGAIFLATAFSSCKQTSKMGCPSYQDNQRYYKEKW